MRRKDVKTMIAYYFGIPAMRALLEDERTELEAEYNRNRLEEISVRDHVLIRDQEIIQDCLDVLKGEYKRLLFFKHRDKYSWAKIAAKNGVPERTAHWRYDKAVDRLGEALEEVPMVEELWARALRARD